MSSYFTNNIKQCKIKKTTLKTRRLISNSVNLFFSISYFRITIFPPVSSMSKCDFQFVEDNLNKQKIKTKIAFCILARVPNNTITANIYRTLSRLLLFLCCCFFFPNPVTLVRNVLHLTSSDHPVFALDIVKNPIRLFPDNTALLKLTTWSRW